MVKKVVLSLIFLTLFASCANQLTQNIVKEGESLIAGGVSADKEWDDKMIFKRVSWYKDFTLLFDSNMWKVSAQSPFLNWFSTREKSYLNSCEEFYVVLTYSMDADLISENDFFKQLEMQGAEFMEMPQLKSNLKLHPHFEENSFQLYKVGGLCMKKAGTQLKITFPGYQEKLL